MTVKEIGALLFIAILILIIFDSVFLSRKKQEILTDEEQERKDLEEEERIWDIEHPNCHRGRRLTKSESERMPKPRTNKMK